MGWGEKEVAHEGVWENYDDKSDDIVDSNESLEELFAMERTANRFPNTGDDRDDDETEDANEGAGLGHAFATRTPGPKMRRGDVDPFHFCMGIGAGMKEMGVRVGLGSIEWDNVGFGDRSGSS